MRRDMPTCAAYTGVLPCCAWPTYLPTWLGRKRVSESIERLAVLQTQQHKTASANAAKEHTTRVSVETARSGALCGVSPFPGRCGWPQLSLIFVVMWQWQAESLCRCGSGRRSHGADVAALIRVPARMLQGKTIPGSNPVGTSPVPVQMRQR